MHYRGCNRRPTGNRWHETQPTRRQGERARASEARLQMPWGGCGCSVNGRILHRRSQALNLLLAWFRCDATRRTAVATSCNDATRCTAVATMQRSSAASAQSVMPEHRRSPWCCCTHTRALFTCRLMWSSKIAKDEWISAVCTRKQTNKQTNKQPPVAHRANAWAAAGRIMPPGTCLLRVRVRVCVLECARRGA